MAAISAIRAGIGTNLKTVDNLNVHSRASIPQPNPPMVVVRFAGFPEVRQAMAKGLTEMLFDVVVMVADSSNVGGGEDALDAYCATTGDQSIWVALESDATLGSTVSDSVVTDMSGHDFVEFGNRPMVTCTWSLTVYADASV